VNHDPEDGPRGGELDPELKATERVIRYAIRSWAAALRLCLIVAVVAATSAITVWAEGILNAAIRSWAAALRLCLIVAVVAATSAITVYFIDPSVLRMVMK
jgi:hypothetical protein